MDYQLFLDDVRSPPNADPGRPDRGAWIVARSFEEFVLVIETRGLPRAVSFDHDLADQSFFTAQYPLGVPGGRERNGATCARWLAERCLDQGLPLPDYAVHSANGEGAANIRSIMNSAARVSGRAS